MGAYDALRKLGPCYSRRYRVMGFDNEQLIAAHLYPPLSTMQLPHYEMGEWAVNYLIEHDANLVAGRSSTRSNARSSSGNRLEMPLGHGSLQSRMIATGRAVLREKNTRQAIRN